MKALIFFSIILVSGIVSGQNIRSLFDFTVTDIQGNEFPLSQLKGKKILIVNTASKCGFTPQYDDLEKLYNTYKEKKFVIIGFPANNFLKQESGTNEEILNFCRKNYGVTFPMMSKISVKGNDIHPLYKWLTSETKSEVSWNFQKYMIDENGKIVDYVSPNTKPFDPKIINWILK
jgi:glutathione peroxidase